MAFVPTALGYDARLQFIHEDDALEILRLATVGDQTGIFNAAGDGTLLLSQALRMAGRVSVPVPTIASGLTGQLFRRVGLADFSPEQVRFLAHGRVVDCTRLHEVLGYRPKYSTLEAFTEFVRERLGAGPLDVERVRAAEQAFQRALRATERARRSRQRERRRTTEQAAAGRRGRAGRSRRPGRSVRPRAGGCRGGRGGECDGRDDPGPAGWGVRGRRVRLRRAAEPTRSSRPRCGRSIVTGSASRCAASSTCRRPARGWSSPTTRARCRWTRS